MPNTYQRALSFGGVAVGLFVRSVCLAFGAYMAMPAGMAVDMVRYRRVIHPLGQARCACRSVLSLVDHQGIPTVK